MRWDARIEQVEYKVGNEVGWFQNPKTKQFCSDSDLNVDGRKRESDKDGVDYDFIQDVIRDLLSDPEAIKVSHWNIYQITF